MPTLRIDGNQLTVQVGMTILHAARDAGIYIPSLCFHPDLPPSKKCASSDSLWRGNDNLSGKSGEFFDGCRLCAVEVEGSSALVTSCDTEVVDGMVIKTSSPRIVEFRKDRLAEILATHPHACLTCAQKEGCSREPCSTNVPVPERCCPKLGRCELQKVAEFIGIRPDTPRYVPSGLPVIDSDPLIRRDYNLCIGCTRCIRACRDLRGVDALAYIIQESHTSTSPEGISNSSNPAGTSDGNTLGSREDSLGSPRKKLIVGSRLPSLADSGCKFCGACIEVCPTGALMDKKPITGDRPKALVPCIAFCPLEINVPEYVRRIARGCHMEAAAVILEKAPLPRSLGRVCFHPCEENCRRGEINDPIAICALKRFAWDRVATGIPQTTADSWPLLKNPSSTNGKLQDTNSRKVAIIGAGPAGITAAYYLKRKGYNVTIFEALHEPGGMLRHAIPEYRLPNEILMADLSTALEGITIKTNIALGKDFTLEQLLTGGIDSAHLTTSPSVQGSADASENALLHSGYAAVLLAIGAQLSRRINVPGTDLEGVLWGLDFLKDVRINLSRKQSNTSSIGDATSAYKRNFKGLRVIVVGGGNVAMDVALTAKRLGASSVIVVCLESSDEMPAHRWEVQNVLAEGIEIFNSWGPKQIIGHHGRVTGIEFKRCTAVFDAEGKFNPSFDEGHTRRLDADIVILAVGQAVDLSTLQRKSHTQLSCSSPTTQRVSPSEPDSSPVVETSQGFIKVIGDGCLTNVRGVFAAGDATGKTASVVEAMAHGRKAAAAIDHFLGGTGEFSFEESPKTRQAFIGREEGFARRHREAIPCLAMDARSNNFAEIETGYDEKAAVAEASRCLQCDLRLDISQPPMPPEKWLPFVDENISNVPESEGAFQLLDEQKRVIYIAGTPNLRQALREQLAVREKAKFFIYEEDPMYTKRESEWIQEFIQQHGRMPEGNEELDELF